MQGASAHKSRRVHAFAASALQFMQAQYALAASDVDSLGAGREDGPAGRARIGNKVNDLGAPQLDDLALE